MSLNTLFGSTALELAISLSLFFFVSSLICTAAREMIEAAMKTRALDLERALRELLADKDGTGLVRELFNHPVIAGLFLGSYDPSSLQPSEKGVSSGKLSWAGRRNLPSYIPAGQFSAALVDLVTRGSGDVPYAPPRPAGPIDLSRLREDAERLADPTLRRALQVATDGARTLDEARLRIEAWFNGSMDRASGWYKRRTQWILFGLGLATAVLMNLDTVTVTRRLFVDGNLRAAAVSAAETRVRTTDQGNPGRPGTIRELQAEFKEIGFPMGWSLQPWPFPLAQAEICLPAPAACPHRFTTLGDGRRAFITAGDLILMPVGWLITALAVTLGAPFWFDLLNRFIVVRATVKPSQKSQDEASPERVLNASPPGGDMVPGDEASVAARTAAAGPEPTAPTKEAAEIVVINRWAIGIDPDEGLL